MFTRTHYKAIAEIVRHTATSVCKFENLFHTPLANELADYFAADNPRFDRARFLTACGVESGHNICPFTDALPNAVSIVDDDRWREFKTTVPSFQSLQDSCYYLHECPDTGQSFLVEVGVDNNIAVVHDVPAFLMSVQ